MQSPFPVLLGLVNPATMRSRRILVPTDFSADSKRALAEAFRLNGNSRILLLHVVTGPVSATKTDEVVQSVRAQLKRFCEADGEVHSRAQCHVRFGVAFREILKFAEEKNVDLIVLVRGEETRRVLGQSQTADRVARYADCAVMLLRSAEEGTEALPV
jgi:nucleotide-binding universal stress UspA family protein